ncbi:O-antigen ligase family protein [Psychromonas sp. MME2]|uniref:O-antigen ligase family protein n=1 Tax=unclassified Psychromonas TaxID=2614957 RepID=UPI00339C489B
MKSQHSSQQAITFVQNFLLHLPLLWMFSGLMMLQDGRSIMTRILVVAVITAIYIGRKSIFSGTYKDKKNRYFIFFIGLNIIYLLLSKVIHHVDHGFIRTLFVSSLYFYFYPVNRYHINWLKASILIGTTLLACFAYWQAFLLGITRIGEPMNAIPFATCCMLLSISAALIANNTQCRKEFIIFTLASLVALFCTFLTGTRGVLIAIIPCLLIINLHKKINLKVGGTLILLLIMVAIANQRVLTTMWQRTANEIQNISNDNLNTSVGLRLQFWKSAIYTINDHPFLGVGTKAFRNEISKQYEQGLTSEEVVKFNPMHYHNQFIDTTVKTGFIGLLLMLSIFLYCLYLALISKVCETLPITMIIASLGIAALTDVPFAHLPVVYLLFMLLFLGINNLFNTKTVV